MDLPQQKDITFQNPGKKKLKINFLRIWSLDFSSYTSYDFLIAKERTPHSQKCARISIDSKSIPDSVTNFFEIPLQIITNRRVQLFACVHHNCTDKNDNQKKREYPKRIPKEYEGKHFRLLLMILC